MLGFSFRSSLAEQMVAADWMREQGAAESRAAGKAGPVRGCSSWNWRRKGTGGGGSRPRQQQAALCLMALTVIAPQHQDNCMAVFVTDAFLGDRLYGNTVRWLCCPRQGRPKATVQHDCGGRACLLKLHAGNGMTEGMCDCNEVGSHHDFISATVNFKALLFPAHAVLRAAARRGGEGLAAVAAMLLLCRAAPPLPACRTVLF